MSDNSVFSLQVPLDASQVKNIDTARAVKVVAYGAGLMLEQTVQFNDRGQASASFTFDQNPGALNIALGPGNASAEDLQHMQTISVNVPASSWSGARRVTISPVSISPYFWRWWWRWCQTYTITGRVLCPDGSPVAGATVCAFDVDAWWWWISKQQVGCVTTQRDGSFEITFTRCCGWLPWWWWETREWLLDPYLVDQITAAFKQNSTLTLPRATPQPSLAVFDQLLASSAASARARRAANVALQGNPAAVVPFTDPAALEPLRTRLLEVVPREFPFPIWPWYPWYPWWNCAANVIFQVTQSCGGEVNAIVNETLADVRWSIPADLNVTLTANDQACCVFGCSNQECPEGYCLTPSDICDINIGSVGGNIGNSASLAQVGLAYPGTQDRPFAGAVSFFGQVGTLVDYYEIQYSTTGLAGSYAPLPLQAIAPFVRQVLVSTGSGFTWNPVLFAPTSISDGTTSHNVIETTYHYNAVNGPQEWDSYTYGLLLVLNSLNVLPNGTYYLQVIGWQRPGTSGDLTNGTVLSICEQTPTDNPPVNYWVVTLDNQAPGNTDPTGQTCGLHTCTDQPLSQIIQVAIQHQNGTTTPITGCGVVCIVDTDQLLIDFAAYDPDGFLAYYNLDVLYSSDQSVNLVSVGTLTASPLAPSYAPAPPIGPNAPNQTLVGPSYGAALGQGAASPVWKGGSMRLTVGATNAFPVLPCAYLLQLWVYKRPIVNCDEVDDVQQNTSFLSFTVQECSPGLEA